MKIVNLTPHEIILIGIKIPPEATPARVSEKTEVVDLLEWSGIQLHVIKKEFGEIQNLPEPQPDTIFVASLLVAQAAKRRDVLAIGEAVRDEKGNIVGAKSLAVV